MVYNRISGRVEGAAPPGADSVFLTWDERRKRVLRVTTAGGREVGIRLDRAELRCGLLLESDGLPPLWIGAAPEPMLVVAPALRKEFAFAAHIIGNRHIPAWIGEEELLVREDRVLEEALLAHGIAVRRESRLLDERAYLVSGGGHTSHVHADGFEGGRAVHG